jgi:hypothetical protein
LIGVAGVEGTRGASGTPTCRVGDRRSDGGFPSIRRSQMVPMRLSTAISNIDCTMQALDAISTKKRQIK